MLENSLIQQFQTDIKVNLQMRGEIDKNIASIMDKSSHNFAALYNHPKLSNEMISRKTRSTSWGKYGMNFRLKDCKPSTIRIGSHLTVNNDLKEKLIDINKKAGVAFAPAAN